MRRIDEIGVNTDDTGRTVFTYKCNDGSEIIHGVEGTLFNNEAFASIFQLSYQAALDSTKVD